MILLIAFASQIKSIVVYFKLQLFYPSLKNLLIFGLGKATLSFVFGWGLSASAGNVLKFFSHYCKKWPMWVIYRAGNRLEITVCVVGLLSVKVSKWGCIELPFYCHDTSPLLCLRSSRVSMQSCAIAAERLKNWHIFIDTPWKGDFSQRALLQPSAWGQFRQMRIVACLGR